MLSAPAYARAACSVLLTVAALAAACSDRRDPITIQEGQLVVENQTSTEWRDVVITVNDHFRGGARTLLPGGRVHAPLNELRTGFGQRFDRGRMSVYKVDVTATDADGNPVKLELDRRR
jgi:hypothetical protein